MKIPKNILDEISAYYENLTSIHEQNKFYLEEYLNTNDEYVSAKNAVRSLELKLYKAEYNKSENVDEIKSELKKLNERLNIILSKLKVNIDKFEPKFKCKNCRDTGFIDGKLCKCYIEKTYEIILNKVGVPKRNLHTFSEDTLSTTAGLESHYEVGKKFAEKFSKTEIKNFVFTGKSGTGKTFLAESIISEVKRKGYFTLYLKSSELNALFLQTHIAPLEEKTLISQILTEVDLLVIDDLGTEPIYKNVTSEYLLSLITDRLNLDKQFIITTNLTINEIKSRYGEQHFSRLLDKTKTRIIQFNNEDLRIKK